MYVLERVKNYGRVRTGQSNSDLKLQTFEVHECIIYYVHDVLRVYNTDIVIFRIVNFSSFCVYRIPYIVITD